MKRNVSMPFSGWPQADQVMWSSLITGDDPFGDVGALSHLRATSQAALVKHYGRWLEWLFQSAPEALNQPPEHRATPERLAGWITSLHHVAPPTLYTFVSGVIWVLKAAAPDQGWKLQRLAAKRLRRVARKSRSDRKTGRVLSSVVLFDAAKDLIGPASARANTPLNAALMRRGGAMIALLTMMPIRLRSLSELTLGVSVQVSPTRIMICLSGDMTKNGHPWEAQVPVQLDQLLRLYIEEVRPWLMRRKGKHHQMLWVSRMGEPLTYATMKNTITIATKREIGIAISPHLFRDAAATTLVRQSPKDTRSIRALLGHSSFEIAERHYIHAMGIEAGRNYATVIANLTRKGP